MTVQLERECAKRPELLRARRLAFHPSLLHAATQAANEDALRCLLRCAQDAARAAAIHGGGGALPSSTHAAVNARNARGQTPLMLAAIHPAGATCVRLLLGAGADPWAADSCGGRTALFYAACADAADSAAALLDATQEALLPRPVFPNGPATRYVDVRMLAGFTALHVAVVADARGALRELLRGAPRLGVPTLFGSYDFIVCTRGTCPMHLAARMGRTEAAKMLLLAHVSARGRQGMRGVHTRWPMHALRLVAGAMGTCPKAVWLQSSRGMLRPAPARLHHATATFWPPSHLQPKNKSCAQTHATPICTHALRPLHLRRPAPQLRPVPWTPAPSWTTLAACPATWRPSTHTMTSHTCCSRACRSQAHWAAMPACTSTEHRPSSCWPRQRCACGSKRRLRLRRPRSASAAAATAALSAT
jgi:ankyrin repeat protein